MDSKIQKDHREEYTKTILKTKEIRDAAKKQYDRIKKTTKDYFKQIHQRYRDDKKESVVKNPKTVFCVPGTDCALQPELYDKNVKNVLSTATTENEAPSRSALKLSTTQEFFRKTMNALVEKNARHEKAPNIIVNYWGTGTGKTLGSLLFLCAEDITDCFIMVSPLIQGPKLYYFCIFF